ncbi:MAG: hypothetical protein ACU0DW_01200 [Shimia sp.]
MTKYENHVVSECWQYRAIQHAFSFTAAASLCSFAITISRSTTKYCTAFVIPGVVTASATLQLFLLWPMWNLAFALDAETATIAREEGRAS